MHNLENIEDHIEKFQQKGSCEKKVLIVEDNYINLTLIERVIKKVGIFQVFTAKNGKEAISSYEMEKPDIIIMDIQMPVMNGYESHKAIVKIAEANNLAKPIFIALTASSLDEDKERCLNAGMDYFISKPFKIEEIRNILLDIKNAL